MPLDLAPRYTASATLGGQASGTLNLLPVVPTGLGVQLAPFLKGDPGTPGADGEDGLSAYQLAVAAGFVGTQAEWLASLKGEPGDPGTPGADGDDGLSAKQLAVAAGFVGTQAEWLASLKGEPGDPGESAPVMPDGTTALGWVGGQLAAVDYPDGSSAALTWSGGVLQAVATTRAGSTRTRTLTWAGGVLQSVNTTTTP